MSVGPNTLRLIEDAHRFGAAYGGGLASHLPMALLALDAMGASDERIEAYALQYGAQLEHLHTLLGLVKILIYTRVTESQIL